MKVIGIDPAPAKDTVIYDGEKFIEIPAIELKKYLEIFKEDTLICWDAPLTGGLPTNFDQGKKEYNPFSQRKIEQLINGDNKTIKGISTRGYAECSHWAITQHCFGLPLINDKFKPLETPTTFKLITSHNERKELSSKKNYIVEVHPALALLLWLIEENKIEGDDKWNYKKNKETFNILVNKLFKKIEIPQAIAEPKDDGDGKYKVKVTVIKNKVEKNSEKIMKDDHLDAYIAWQLGTLWLEKENEVLLVGNHDTGLMLLPNDASGIGKKWQETLKE